MLHVYFATGMRGTLEAAMALVEGSRVEVWPLEYEDAALARQLSYRFPNLASRDSCRLTSCRRRDIRGHKTFDRGLESASG